MLVVLIFCGFRLFWICGFPNVHILWCWWHSHSEYVILTIKIMLCSVIGVHDSWCWWHLLLAGFCGVSALLYLWVLWCCWYSCGFCGFKLSCSYLCGVCVVHLAVEFYLWHWYCLSCDVHNRLCIDGVHFVLLIWAVVLGGAHFVEFMVVHHIHREVFISGSSANMLSSSHHGITMI